MCYDYKGDNMNRTSLCIKMLQILNAHDFVTTKELAERLETNPRNILEYKKELEVAGYSIETIRGKYGGYRLADKANLVSIPLNDKEKKAMNEAYSYLHQHQDFLMFNEYREAFEKIQFTNSFLENKSETHYQKNDSKISPIVLKMIHLCEQAKKESVAVLFDYRSIHSSRFLQVELWPYEILNIKGEYYCLGYNKEKHSFRTYKFSEIRMKNIKVSNKKFMRDHDFDVSDFLGKKGLMKDEIIDVEFIISGKNAILYSERTIGISDEKKLDDTMCLHVKTQFEGKMNAMQFLCSLGSSCEVLAPRHLREEIKKEIDEMAQKYL